MTKHHEKPFFEGQTDHRHLRTIVQVNVESNNLLGYASCWIQQLVAPGVLQVVGFSRLGAYFTV